MTVRDHIPLEQGLRHCLFTFIRQIRNVRDHIPLEQGLRQLVGTNGRSELAQSETIFH